MNLYTEEHRPFCTKRQEDFLDLALTGMGSAEIADKLGINRRTAQRIGERIIATGKRHGLYSDTDIGTPAQALPVSGTSTLYKTDGYGDTKPTLTWVKTSRAGEELIAEARAIAAAMSEEICPVEPVAKLLPLPGIESLANLHVLTDIHIGMYAWQEETGDANWSTAIAEDMIMKWFAYSIDKAPDAKTGILAQLGDLFHQDGVNPVTPMHGHLLDSDTRWQEVIRTGIRILRKVINMMLQKYDVVHFNSLSGNHDTSTGGVIREMFFALYDNEPRVIVDTSPSDYQALQFGDVALYFHHGHKRSPKNIDHVLASRFRKMYGNTKHAYAHLGHRHCRVVEESNLMIIEQHGTMAPSDAYSAGAGYNSSRGAEVIVYHEKYGEVGRQRTNPEMLR